jgi:Zn-dependent peptidase ImmA (M78 family)
VRVFHAYGSPQRLFEMLKRVNNLNEQILPKEKKEEVINKFVAFVQKKLDISDDQMPKIAISYDEKEAPGMKSFGKYTPETNELRVVAINRNLADVLRTLAHELKHNEQRIKGILKPNSTETGSNVENEANAFAGIAMREFGQANPIIFE